MDIDTHVDGTEWWLTIWPTSGPPIVHLGEADYWAIVNTRPPRRCEVEVPGSHRGQQCPNYREPGEWTCRDHPLPSGDPW